MDYILKKFKARCKEELKKYGFHPYRNNHYRVVNDIFQSFNLHRSISGWECTVEFSIVPLSVGYDIRKDTVNSYHLKNFENSAEWFKYDKNSIEDMDACVDKLLYYMIKHLLPIYIKADSCEKAYSIMNEYEYIFQCNSYEKFCMCIKKNDYIQAENYLHAVINQHKEAFEINMSNFKENAPVDYVMKMKEELADYTNLMEKVKQKDEKFLYEWASQNERRNLYNLGIK